jgi:hypothetical protein
VKRMLLLLASIAAGLVISSSAADVFAAAGPPELDVGDRFRVRGVEVGCRVAKISELGGRTVVDCRRAGPLAGTYGAMVSEREVAVVQFRSGREAKIVFEARHKGSARRCAG